MKAISTNRDGIEHPKSKLAASTIFSNFLYNKVLKAFVGTMFPPVFHSVLSLAIIFSCVLSAGLLLVYSLVSYIEYTDQGEKITAFECGFDPLSKIRAPFSTRFFLLVVLFLIFDVEVALIFPILRRMIISSTRVSLIIAILVFLSILFIGILHEWNEGALDWVRTSTGQLNISYWAHNSKMESSPIELCSDVLST